MCKMDDAVIGVTASVSKILASIVYAFAETQNAFYFGKYENIILTRIILKYNEGTNISITVNINYKLDECRIF